MIVLLYHRVCELATDPQWLCVHPVHFDQQLEVIRRGARIVPLSEALPVTNSHAGRDDRVAITFDDGYADNYTEALPILKRHNASATVFVTTRPDRSTREFWWDALEARLLRPGMLPRILEIQVGSQRRAWDLGDAAVIRESDFQSHRRWNVTQPPRTPRQACYMDLCEWLRPMSSERQQSVIEQLDSYQDAPPVARDTHRCLADEDIRALAASGLVEIGAHTVTHPVLSALPRHAQARELWQSRITLEAILDRRVETCSYPYGTRRDFSTTTREEARAAGYHMACANFAGPVCESTNPFQLPRYLVRDWNGESFECCLREWLRHE